MHVACGIDPGYRRGMISLACLYIRPAVHFHAEVLRYIVLASQESRSDEYQLCRKLLLRSFHRNHLHPPGLRVPLCLQGNDRNAVQFPVLVLMKFLYRGLIDPWIMTEHPDRFLLSVVRLPHPRPLRPGIGIQPLTGRFRHHFQLGHGFCAQADGGSHAVISGVSAADNDHILSLRQLRRDILKITVQKGLRHFCQEIHRKADPLRISSGCLDISGIGSPACKDHRVEGLLQFLCGNVHAYIYTCPKDNPCILHETDPPVDHGFLQLHIRDPVAEQAARTVTSFIYCHAVSPAVQELSRCKTCRSASHDGNRFPGPRRRYRFQYQTMLKCILDHGSLIFLCCNRFRVKAAGTGSLAESRAYTGGEFREAVGPGQTDIGLLIISPVYQIIHFRYQVVQGTSGHHSRDHPSGLAKGNAAVHTPGRLLPSLLFRQHPVELPEAFDPILLRHHRAVLTFIFQKSCRLAHSNSSFSLPAL